MKESIVRVLNDADTHNIEVSFTVLGQMADLPDQIDALYGALNEALKPLMNTEAAQCAGLLYASARTHLATGAIALYRLHASQMSRETRSAVEAAGIARLIQSDKESFEIFLADWDDEQARRAAKNRFTSARLFPKTEADMAPLGEFYAANSDLSHTNRFTLFEHVSLEEDSGNARFSTQDIKHDPGELKKRLSWMCMAHLGVIVAAQGTFKTADFSKIIPEGRYLWGRVQRLAESVAAA